MPASKPVPAFEGTWLALALTCQVFVGAFLGIAAEFVLAVAVIFCVLPWIGLELLDTARAVAQLDLPMRVLGFWWGRPSAAALARNYPLAPPCSPWAADLPIYRFITTTRQSAPLRRIGAFGLAVGATCALYGVLTSGRRSISRRSSANVLGTIRREPAFGRAD